MAPIPPNIGTFERGTPHDNVWIGALADGSVRTFSVNVDELVWVDWLNPDDRDPVDVE